MRRRLLPALLIATAAASPATPARAATGAPPTEATLPAVARDPEKWTALVRSLLERGMDLGAMAAAQRMPALFPQVGAKEAAYRAIVELADRGYPGPVRSLFFAADLEPSAESPDDTFPEDYYFYKAVINREKGDENWARYYLRKIDPAKSERLQYYDALQSYGKKDLADAEARIAKILATPNPKRSPRFTRQLMRLLARLRYERKDHVGSLAVYDGFLLKQPRILPTDWIEAAWNLYFLKQPAKALGYLYNLESRSMNTGEIPLEKYLLRGLIYHDLCNLDRIGTLLKDFEGRYLPLINRIKNGEKIEGNAVLAAMRATGTIATLDLTAIEKGLASEARAAGKLPSSLSPLAAWVYSTERKLLEQRSPELARRAADAAARELLITHESLRFLNFEILRSRVNPDAVFARKKASSPLVEEFDGSDQGFQVSWPQPGDFWRDERLKYRAEVQNECGN